MTSLGETAHGPIIDVEPGRTTGWWGMICLIATEGTLFALLLFMWFYFQANRPEWPPPGIPLPELKATAVRTVIRVASSVTMVLAVRAMARKGRAQKTAVWLLVTIALAAVFTVGHWQEQRVLLRDLAPHHTAYGSVFITIVNFDVAHYAAGIGILTFLFAQTLRGVFTRDHHGMIKLGAMYWHFLNVSWIAFFAALYLAPHFVRLWGGP